MLTFEEIISNLQGFWQSKGCAVLQPCDLEVGAATLNYQTAMGVLDSKVRNFVQVQYCKRQADGRMGESSNRRSAYYQMQVIMKPSPVEIQKYALQSFESIGIDLNSHDFRFVEDNWKNPSIGATGVGYEVWCDNMEIMQFTYMSQIGGLPCQMNPVELTYGLERLAMYVQNVDSMEEIMWNKDSKYQDIHPKEFENESCLYYQKYHNDKDILLVQFEDSIKTSLDLLKNDFVMPAYEKALKASNTLNILDARGYLSQNDRMLKILTIRNAVKDIMAKYLEKYN